MSVAAVHTQIHAMEVLGDDRHYVTIRPADPDPSDLPAIIDLHGSGSHPAEHAEVTCAATVAARGAIIVLPQAAIPFQLLDGWPPGWAWNVPGSPLPGESAARDTPNDLVFIHALIDRLIERDGVDPGRIHLRGYSGGARLSSHLLASNANRFRSVCCVAGVRFIAPRQGTLPPLLAIHGQQDTFNPYDGGSGPRWDASVPEAVERWATASQCHPTPHEEDLDDVHVTSYIDPGTGQTTVRLIAVSTAQHSWPGTTHADHIAQFGDAGHFSASEAHWNFIRNVESVPA